MSKNKAANGNNNIVVKRRDILKQEQTKFTLRVESELLRKFHHVAKCNLRSANRELEAIIKKHVAEYEKEYGEIKRFNF